MGNGKIPKRMIESKIDSKLLDGKICMARYVGRQPSMYKDMFGLLQT